MVDKLKRREYQYFALKPFKFFICACTKLHFFVITFLFDPTSTEGNLFQDVTIYDSLKRVTRHTNDNMQTRFGNRSEGSKFLIQLQDFFKKFVLYGTDFYNVLEYDPNFILTDVKYCERP